MLDQKWLVAQVSDQLYQLERVFAVLAQLLWPRTPDLLQVQQVEDRCFQFRFLRLRHESTYLARK